MISLVDALSYNTGCPTGNNVIFCRDLVMVLQMVTCNFGLIPRSG
jgi:hypothetical protein